MVCETLIVEVFHALRMVGLVAGSQGPVFDLGRAVHGPRSVRGDLRRDGAPRNSSLDAKFGIRTHFIDTTDLAAVDATLAANPSVRVVFLETPENPNLGLADLRRTSEVARRHEALLVVDNTFCSPYVQQPFRLGADIIVQSMTKYVNGHSASVAGNVLGPFPFMSGEFFNMAKDLGPTPSPFDGWLNGLCIQTLPQRIDEAVASAELIARWLDGNPKVEKVYYPGLASHPHHELVGKQMRNGGAMIAFELVWGFDPAVRLMNYFARHDTPMELAVSLGSVISYIEHPASMTHAGVPQEVRRERGISDGLVRVSVGLEGATTLIRAFEEGFRLAYDWMESEESAEQFAEVNAIAQD